MCVRAMPLCGCARGRDREVQTAGLRVRVLVQSHVPVCVLPSDENIINTSNYNDQHRNSFVTRVKLDYANYSLQRTMSHDLQVVSIVFT